MMKNVLQRKKLLKNNLLVLFFKTLFFFLLHHSVYLSRNGGKPQVILAEVDAHGGGEVTHAALLSLAILVLG